MTHTKDEALKLALEAGAIILDGSDTSVIERLVQLAQAAERNKLAAWMMAQGYATGHGDTTEDLLKELEWQVCESEREACAKFFEDHWRERWTDEQIVEAIRARDQR
jgi:hypothetical protein